MTDLILSIEILVPLVGHGVVGVAVVDAIAVVVIVIIAGAAATLPHSVIIMAITASGYHL